MQVSLFFTYLLGLMAMTQLSNIEVLKGAVKQLLRHCSAIIDELEQSKRDPVLEQVMLAVRDLKSFTGEAEKKAGTAIEEMGGGGIYAQEEQGGGLENEEGLNQVVDMVKEQVGTLKMYVISEKKRYLEDQDFAEGFEQCIMSVNGSSMS